jgi:prepilin-type N-terminal cleavage/methylation domain-containing protein
MKYCGTHHSKTRAGFSLMELLVVMGVILAVAALVLPAVTGIKKSGDITKAAYDIAGMLETARAHAMAYNTHTWVGFYEEDSGAAGPTTSTPPYEGVGRVVIALVASKDGSRIYDHEDPPATLPSDRLNMIGKLIRLENIHLSDIGEPPGGAPGTLEGRSPAAYTYGETEEERKLSRISSESDAATAFPFTVQDYVFHKTIMFNPRGEASVPNSSGDCLLRPVVEIGLRPTHGNAVDSNDPNVIAIQLTGIGGNVEIFRR